MVPLAHAEVVHQMVFYHQDVRNPIVLTIVDSRDDFPYPCGKNMEPNHILVGCAQRYTDGSKNFIFLDINHITYIDEFGYSTLWHELKHLICKCNFHDKRFMV